MSRNSPSIIPSSLMVSAHTTGNGHPEPPTLILHQPTAICRLNTKLNLEQKQDPSCPTSNKFSK